MLFTKTMPLASFPVRHGLLATATALLTTLAAPAEAGIVSGQRQTRAVISDAPFAGTLHFEVIDGAPFFETLETGRTDEQGKRSSASMTQSSVFDSKTGSSGVSETRIDTGVGVTGDTLATLVANFDLATPSTFTVHGLYEVDGNAAALGVLQLFRRFDDGTFLQLFRFELEATTALDLAGVMEPGRYGFFYRNGLVADGSGQSGSARFEYDMRFVAAQVGNTVPEPRSIALAAVALGLLVHASRRRRQPPLACTAGTTAPAW